MEKRRIEHVDVEVHEDPRMTAEEVEDDLVRHEGFGLHRIVDAPVVQEFLLVVVQALKSDVEKVLRAEGGVLHFPRKRGAPRPRIVPKTIAWALG